MRHRVCIAACVGVWIMLSNGCMSVHEVEISTDNRNYLNALALNDARTNRVWFIELESTTKERGVDGKATATLVFSRSGSPQGLWEDGTRDNGDVASTIRLGGCGADLVRSVIASNVGADVIVLDSSDVDFPQNLRKVFWTGLPEEWSVSDDGIAASNRRWKE